MALLQLLWCCRCTSFVLCLVYTLILCWEGGSSVNRFDSQSKKGLTSFTALSLVCLLGEILIYFVFEPLLFYTRPKRSQSDRDTQGLRQRQTLSLSHQLWHRRQLFFKVTSTVPHASNVKGSWPEAVRGTSRLQYFFLESRTHFKIQEACLEEWTEAGSCVWTLLALSKCFESERSVESFGRTVAALINAVCYKAHRDCMIYRCSGSLLYMSTSVEWEELSQRFQFVLWKLIKEKWKNSRLNF